MKNVSHETLPAGALRKIDAHQFEQQPENHYVEPHWADRVLFENETFRGLIHDPCCGFGRIPLAARAAGYTGVTGGDLVDRGFPGVGVGDFLTGELTATHGNIVMNPPFDICEEFIRRALVVADRKVASIMPTRRLNAAHWMRELGLIQVWYLTPRPSMPPGHVAAEYEAAGKTPSGGKQDFCWVIFDSAAVGQHRRTEVGWLHRDRGVI